MAVERMPCLKENSHFGIEGVVVDVTHDLHSSGGLLFTIHDERNQRVVSVPYPLHSSLSSFVSPLTEIEVAPYQQVFMQETVKYRAQRTVSHDCGSYGYTRDESSFSLLLCSGKLKGKKYEVTR